MELTANAVIPSDSHAMGLPLSRQGIGYTRFRRFPRDSVTCGYSWASHFGLELPLKLPAV